MRKILNVLVFSLAISVLAGCVTSPTSGERIFSMVSTDQENEMGAGQHASIVKQFGGVNKNAKLNEFVAKIGSRLAPYAERKDVRWTFTVLDNEMVNAFAVPGGYIYITRGLLALAQDESQVAAVLAHEMGHVNARHSAQQMSQGMLANIGLQAIGIATGSSAAAQAGSMGADMFIKKYSREHEYEADSLSVRYLTAAGYDPYANAKFLAMLQRHSQLEARMAGKGDSAEFSYFSTHPPTQDRIVRARALADQVPKNPNATIDRESYLTAINGTIYGENADQGIVRGQSFIHPTLKIRFDAPQGFTLKNTPQKVIAQNGRGAAVIFDTGGANTTDPAAYISQAWAKGAALSGVEKITINGMNAATAGAQVQSNEGVKDAQLVAAAADPGKFYRLTFLSPTGAMGNYATEFRRATYSLKRLSDAEAHQITPNTVRVVTVKSGDTIQSLAAKMPVTDFAVERFCLLNDLQPQNGLAVGTRIKIVQ